MIDKIVLWVFNDMDPAWIFMVFPLLFGSIVVGVWREHRKQMKLEANPINMTDIEYRRFNNKRFQK